MTALSKKRVKKIFFFHGTGVSVWCGTVAEKEMFAGTLASPVSIQPSTNPTDTTNTKISFLQNLSIL